MTSLLSFGTAVAVKCFRPDVIDMKPVFPPSVLSNLHWNEVQLYIESSVYGYIEMFLFESLIHDRPLFSKHFSNSFVASTPQSSRVSLVIIVMDSCRHIMSSSSSAPEDR
ncbi:hypothetical protein TNCV_1225891 [Trichonephila clavipes]|nr:hypothetical protein TNCV_1225891 [Trichonephila clavipes]